jgi:hypothetical protein
MKKAQAGKPRLRFSMYGSYPVRDRELAPLTHHGPRLDSQIWSRIEGRGQETSLLVVSYP